MTTEVATVESIAPTPPSQPMMALRSITKTFPGLVANDAVDLDIFGGEVHAVLGENGAGKSTLMKVAYGFYRADSGEVQLNGQTVKIRTPYDARRLNIGMVFQNFTLIPAFSVAENIALFLRDLPLLMDKKKIAREIEELSNRFGFSIDPNQLAGRLSIGEQQKVEVLKLLLAGARLLVFDEPTSVLPPHEVDGLLQVFDRLKESGFAVIFITHKLDEVLRSADRITVMRKGTVSGTMLVAGATQDSLISMMFGTAPPAQPRRRKPAPSEDIAPFLELRGVETRSSNEAPSLKGIDLMVRPGEIVGVAGLPGNGQTALGDAILGVERCSTGQRLLLGENATGWSVARTRAAGVGFIPENPIWMAVVPAMSLQENMALAGTAGYSKQGGFAMDWPAVRSHLSDTLDRLGLKIPPSGTAAQNLSGGNLQRFIIARELASNPKLVIAFDPCRGLDVATAAQTRDLLMAARDAGQGVLLVSQDLAELFALSDRLLVLRGGKIAGAFKPEDTNAYEVGRVMTGATG